MKVGLKLKLARKRKGIKLNDAAELLGISTETLSSYESNKTVPTLLGFIKMAKLYDFDVFDIYEVHSDTKGMSVDLDIYELFKAHAKFVIKNQYENDCKIQRHTDEYYEHAYNEYLSDMIDMFKNTENSTLTKNLSTSMKKDTERFFE